MSFSLAPAFPQKTDLLDTPDMSSMSARNLRAASGLWPAGDLSPPKYRTFLVRS